MTLLISGVASSSKPRDLYIWVSARINLGAALALPNSVLVSMLSQLLNASSA